MRQLQQHKIPIRLWMKKDNEIHNKDLLLSWIPNDRETVGCFGNLRTFFFKFTPDFGHTAVELPDNYKLLETVDVKWTFQWRAGPSSSSPGYGPLFA